MVRFLFCALVLLVICSAVIAQQPPASTPWDVTVKTNTVADSTLTVVNRCKQDHQFQVQTTNTPFLHFSATQVKVKGGATQLVPVKFDTRNLAPGVYQGTVLVICQSCKSEGTCMQDREVLQVTLRVTSDSPAAGPPGAPTTNQPAQPPGNPPGPGASGIMLSPIPEAIAEALANALKKKEGVEAEVEKLRADVAAAQEKADKARRAAETAEQDARNAKAQADAARKAVTDAGKAFDQASEAVKKAEAELVAPNRTPEERAAARVALAKAEADLAAAKKALEDARAYAAGVNKQMAADEAAKAKEKKAEADKAAAALAAAQKALAEKEKELLKAEQEVAKAQAAKDKAEQEAREREAAKVAADKAAWEKLWAEDIKRRQEEQQKLADRAVEIEYLIKNIKTLKLIPDKPKRNVPDPTDYIFDKLRQLAGQTVGNFLQTVAGEIGGSPTMPTGVVGVLGEVAAGIDSFFNLSTGEGYKNTLKELKKMNNPNVKPPKPPRNYTDSEAHDKIKKMQELMKELRDKVAAAQAAAGK